MNENYEVKTTEEKKCGLAGKKAAKLIELKSIVTLLLILTVVFVVVHLTLKGQFTISPDFFVGAVMAVMTYYFTRKDNAT